MSAAVPAPGEAPPYLVGSVDRALRLLALLRDHDTLTITEASAALAVAPSTAHRLLGTLAHRGFVRQDPSTRAYRAGPALLELAAVALDRRDARLVARPELEALVAEVGETVHLARLDADQVVFVDSVESTRAARVTSRVGVALPAHSTASGKVLLAQLDPAALRALLPDPLPAVTPRTVTSRAALERQLARVRRAGYATNIGESETGLCAVAVAVDVAGWGPLSLTVSTPGQRLARRTVEAQAAAAGAAAARIRARAAR